MTLSTLGGEFATARRGGMDADDVAYIRTRTRLGYTPDQIAKQLGRSVLDVRPWVAFVRAEDREERASDTASEVARPVNTSREPRVVMSLWRGLITVAPKPPTMKEIALQVAEQYDIGLDDLIGPARNRRAAWPRQAAMWAMVQEKRWSTPQIGKFFGGRDHTTVLHACKAHERRAEQGEIPVVSWNPVKSEAA